MIRPDQWARLPKAVRDRLQADAVARYRREAERERAAERLHARVLPEPVHRCPGCGSWVHDERICHYCLFLANRDMTRTE